MKRIMIFLIAVSSIAFMNAASNSTYFYNSNGQLLSFNDIDIDSIMFSNIDLNGVECDGIVTQLIYAGDSIYQIPIEKMDSVAFTPRMQQKDEYGITIGQEVDLGLSVNWAGWNVGASSPEQYGGYYGWGETEEKDYYSGETYKYWVDSDGSRSFSFDEITNIGANIKGTQYDVARQKWGGSWRMPTIEEFNELIIKCSWIWILHNDSVYGYKVTGPNGNSIFLPAAGYRNGYLFDGTCDGFYWSASFYDDGYNGLSWVNWFGNGYYYSDRTYFRIYGLSVRPVK